jgi:coenzyme F420 hydrogenase subunit beta
MELPNPEGQGRLIGQVINKGLCVRCGACVGLCPYFDYFDGKVVVMDPCPAGTFRCLQICPRAGYTGTSPIAGEMTGDIGVYREIVMARSTDGTIRRGSQYGGVVSALLIYSLEKGSISSAVLTDAGDSLAPKGRQVRERSEVLECSGSRYSASGSLSVMNRAVKGGHTRLAVVGLPCQIEALARMRLMQPDGDERTRAVALSIGLFCTWALDYTNLKTYLARQNVVDPILKFDIPPPPSEAFRVRTAAGWRDFPLSDIRAMVQKGCSLCDDLTAERADVSVGTVEGQEGWNTVISRTDTGYELLQSAVQEGWLETADLAGANLDHLKEAARNKRKRARQAESEQSE